MPNPNNIIPHQFKPGQSGNPKGRPKNTALQAYINALGKTAARKRHDLSSREVDEWEQLILSASVEELQVLVKHSDVPAYPRAMMMAILTEMKNGQSRTIEKLRDRQHGKAKKLELTGANGAALIPDNNLTPEQARDFLKKLEETV